MADNERIVFDFVDNSDKFRKNLKEIEGLVRKNQQRGKDLEAVQKIVASSFQVSGREADRYARKILKLVDAQEDLEKQEKDLGKVRDQSLSAIGFQIQGVREVLGVIRGATGAFSSWAQAQADTVNQINDTATAASLQSETIRGVKLALEASGNELSSVERGLFNFSKRIVDAAAGNKRYKASFDALGVSLNGVAEGTKTADQVFRETISRLSTYENQAEASAIASTLLGDRAGPKLRVAFQGSGDQLERVIGLAGNFENVAGGAGEQAAEWQRQQALLNNALENTSVSLFATLKPGTRLQGLLESSVFITGIFQGEIGLLGARFNAIGEAIRSTIFPLVTFTETVSAIDRGDFEGAFIAGNRLLRETADTAGLAQTALEKAFGPRTALADQEKILATALANTIKFRRETDRALASSSDGGDSGKGDGFTEALSGQRKVAKELEKNLEKLGKVAAQAQLDQLGPIGKAIEMRNRQLAVIQETVNAVVNSSATIEQKEQAIADANVASNAVRIEASQKIEAERQKFIKVIEKEEAAERKLAERRGKEIEAAIEKQEELKEKRVDFIESLTERTLDSFTQLQESLTAIIVAGIDRQIEAATQGAQQAEEARLKILERGLAQAEKRKDLSEIKRIRKSIKFGKGEADEQAKIAQDLQDKRDRIVKRGVIAAAVAQRASAIFGAGVNTSEAVTKLTALFPPPSPGYFIGLPLIVGTGAASAAAIASAPLPQFQHGSGAELVASGRREGQAVGVTSGHAEGIQLVAEEGEVIFSKEENKRAAEASRQARGDMSLVLADGRELGRLVGNAMADPRNVAIGSPLMRTMVRATW